MANAVNTLSALGTSLKIGYTPEYIEAQTNFNGPLLTKLRGLLDTGLKQKELLEKKIGAETDAVKRKHIDAQVRSVDSQLNTFAYEMGVAKHQIYTLHQLHPIDAEAFYKMLEPKLDELMSLMSLRSEQRLNQIT